VTKRSPLNLAVFKKNAFLQEYEQLDKKLFQVPTKLNSPDKLILTVQKTLITQRTSEYSRWLVYSHLGEIEIHVSPKNVVRAIRIFDTLIKLLKFRGHEIIIRHKTYAVVFGEEIEIAIREKLRTELIPEQKHIWNTYNYFPTDKLIFRIDRLYLKEIIDDKKQLEEKIPGILAELEYRGQKKRQERIKHELDRARQREKERLEQELKDRKDKEIHNFRNLIKESKSWNQSIILNNYLKAIEDNAIEKNILTEELRFWLIWAKKKADWYNPFIKATDEIFNEDDRLTF
jgi:hypothetical protein